MSEMQRQNPLGFLPKMKNRIIKESFWGMGTSGKGKDIRKG
jgi:hypothetical protein